MSKIIYESAQNFLKLCGIKVLKESDTLSIEYYKDKTPNQFAIIWDEEGNDTAHSELEDLRSEFKHVVELSKLVSKTEVAELTKKFNFTDSRFFASDDVYVAFDASESSIKPLVKTELEKLLAKHAAELSYVDARILAGWV